jgi:hypothetical protein
VLVHVFIWLMPLGVRTAVAARLTRRFSTPEAPAGSSPLDALASRRVESPRHDGASNVAP